MDAFDSESGSDGMSATLSRVGGDLRGARERLGYTLPAISAHLRIRLPFLEAIEAGRIADLPGNAYAVGFIRTYAQALGLDPDEIARRFKAEANDVNRKTELEFPAPVPERGIPAGAIVLLGFVVAVIAYVGWYRMSGHDRPPSEIVQAVPERLAPLAAPAAPSASPAPAPAPAPTASTASRDSASTVPPPVPVAPSAPPSTTTAAAPSSTSGVSSSPRSANAASALPPPASASSAPNPAVSNPGAPPLSAPGSSASANPSTAATASTQTATASPMPASQANIAQSPNVPAGQSNESGRIMLRAKSDAWIQVREKQGGVVLLNRVLRSGETWQVPSGKTQLVMTTGNAAGTEVLLDGVASPTLGSDGAVRRDLPLDPASISEGKLTAPGPQAAKPSAAATGANPPSPASKPN